MAFGSPTIEQPYERSPNAVLRCRLPLFLSILLVMAAVFCARGQAQTSVTAPHLKVSLVADQGSVSSQARIPLCRRTWAALRPGAGLARVLDQRGDSGEPPEVKWTLPAGVSVGPLQFPAPKRLPLGPLMDFGYEGQVLLPAELHVMPGTRRASPVPITADVRWLVCRQACVPGKAHLTLELPLGTGDASAARHCLPKTFAAMPKVLPARAKAVFSRVPGGFQLAVLTGKRVEGAQFFPADQSVIANAAPQPVTPRRDGAVIALKQDENLQKPPQTLSGIVLLADGTSYLVRADEGMIPAAPISASGSVNLLRYVGFALMGGILLNLMPCVFPVLFIKALALVQSSPEERRAMRVQGMAYTLGILVSFWIVVAILLVLRAGGRGLGWGFQFQSPVFVAMIALLLFFLALSLAGMFEIGLSVTSAGSSLANKHGLAGSFFTGVLAVVVATPCAAPFLGAAIGFALVQPAVVAFAVFTALALGWRCRICCWRSAGVDEVAAEAGRVDGGAETGDGGADLRDGDLAGVGVCAACRGDGADRVAIGISAARDCGLGAGTLAREVACHCDGGGDPGAGDGGARLCGANFQPAETWLRVRLAAHGSHRAWQPFTPDVVAQYQAQGRPVFVDFTADWCLSCQVNERVVLERPDVQASCRMERLRWSARTGRGMMRTSRVRWRRWDARVCRRTRCIQGHRARPRGCCLKY